MTTTQIKELQRKIGGLKVDGVAGLLTRAGIREYLRKLMPAKRFPTRTEIAQNNSIFGRHGTGNYNPPTTTIILPFTVYYESSPVLKIAPHEKAADAFRGFFQRLAELYPTTQSRSDAGVTTYDGLYNPRLMRGSSTTWSMHAWGIAIDLNANENLLKYSWPTQGTMPLEVMECAAKEGLWSLGGMENRDAMHFEATSGV